MEIGKRKKAIRSFQDLEVYQRLYSLMIRVLKELLSKLPREEKYDLVDQLRRCCKSSPALLAEGFAKRYQIRQWRKYLDDAIGEVNEMIHHISIVRDIYSDSVNKEFCDSLIKEYDIANKQIYHLREAWKNFHEK